LTGVHFFLGTNSVGVDRHHWYALSDDDDMSSVHSGKYSPLHYASGADDEPASCMLQRLVQDKVRRRWHLRCRAGSADAAAVQHQHVAAARRAAAAAGGRRLPEQQAEDDVELVDGAHADTIPQPQYID